jgi:hypothetical protein
MHRCFACTDHDDRTSFDDGARLRVPGRFRGPPGNVNGGFATGMLACPVLHAGARDGVEHAVVSRITARLRAGVPVERDLAVKVWPADAGRYAVSVRDGETEVISATADAHAFDHAPRAGDVLAVVPEERSADVGQLAALAVPETAPFFEQIGDHPIPGCFSCGPEHASGLHIYPSFVDDGLTCALWPGSASAFDNADGGPGDGGPGDGTLSQAVLTAAIDCSSGICMPVAMQKELIDRDEFFLLGTMDVHYLRVPPAGGSYRVAAKALRRDGRKFYGLSVLARDDGVAYATAESTWIIANVSRTAAFGR